MTGPGGWDREGLTSPDRLRFERALVALPRGEPDAALVAEAALVIAAAPGLGHRERDRRLQLLLSGRCSVAAILKLVDAIRSVAPGAINALLALVPPDQRVGPAAPKAGPAHSAGGEEPFAPAAPKHAQGGAPPSGDAGDDPTVPTVVLLGTEAEHDHSMRVLRGWGFHPQRHEGPVDPRHVVGPDVCGLFVGVSWWASLPPDGHAGRIRDLITESTFLFLRIGTDGLDPQVRAGLLQQYEDLLGRPPDGSIFCHGVACDLDEADRVPLERVRDLLRRGELSQFHPRGMSEAEAALLRVLAGGSDRRGRRAAAVGVRRLSTGMLAGGRSAARVAYIEPDGGTPLVVKLNDPAKLRDERRRYDEWIKGWDNGEVQAQLHCHGGATGLVYRLVRHAGRAGDPAPTLEDRLRELRSLEMWSRSREEEAGRERCEHDLRTALGWSVAALQKLNATRATAEPTEPFWRHMHMAALCSNGIGHHLRGPGGAALDLQAVIERAVARIRRLDGHAVVHGDVQLRNVLLRDRQPVFIDFEFSGPGHPCLDLASLDTAVALEAFRMLDDEDRLAALFTELLVEGAGPERLKERYQGAFACAGNRLSVETSVKARGAGVALATAHGGGAEDYLAVRLLLSCFALAQLSPQSGVMRACIRALAGAA